MAKSEREKQKQAEEEEKKHRKKQAKQEAVLMLKLEGLRKEVKKAEQKVSKAQVESNSAQVLVQKIEQQLAELRGTGQQVEETAGAQAIQATQPGVTGAVPGEDGEQDHGDVPSQEQIEGQPPAEGRVDSGEDAESQKSPEVVDEPVVIISGEGSMAVESSDEHAWPPPEVRAEVAEAVKEESAKPESTVVEEKQKAIVDEPVVITSGEVSMAVESSDEHAWPPPEVRAEVAEAVREENVEPVGEDGEEDHEEASGMNGEGANGETEVTVRSRRRSSRRSQASS